jgi:hypothetical protein
MSRSKNDSESGFFEEPTEMKTSKRKIFTNGESSRNDRINDERAFIYRSAVPPPLVASSVKMTSEIVEIIDSDDEDNNNEEGSPDRHRYADRDHDSDRTEPESDDDVIIDDETIEIRSKSESLTLSRKTIVFTH